MRLVQVIFGAVTIAIIVLLLWPIFRAGQPQLPVALAIFLGIGALLVVKGLRSKWRWSRYALVGIMPGFLIGGFGAGALVWYGSGTSGTSGTGWEGLVAVAAGIAGAFVGAILGGVLGGIVGVRRDRAERRCSR